MLSLAPYLNHNHNLTVSLSLKPHFEPQNALRFMRTGIWSRQETVGPQKYSGIPGFGPHKDV